MKIGKREGRFWSHLKFKLKFEDLFNPQSMESFSFEKVKNSTAVHSPIAIKIKYCAKIFHSVKNSNI